MSPPNGLHILIIDDERSLTMALARLFRRDGFTVQTASNGRIALTYLETQMYDVILCDLNMPEMDGQVFYRCLCQRYPALCARVIFFTGDMRHATSVFLERSGRPWLTKPVTSTTLRQVVQQVVQETA